MAAIENILTFERDPESYKHWKVAYDGATAKIALDVKEDGGLRPGYRLKLNSYDLGVDIELHDILQRMRFEHPEVRVIVLTSAKDRVFCAGANINMLATSTHGWKVNFCKFTNETRNSIEDMSRNSGIKSVAAVNGACAGGAKSSMSFHSLARSARTPSEVVQNTSARSRRTLRLSVTRVRPPVPGSTPSNGTSGKLTVDERSLTIRISSQASAIS